MTPYYEEDGITIYHGDCREIVPEIARVKYCEIAAKRLAQKVLNFQ